MHTGTELSSLIYDIQSLAQHATNCRRTLYEWPYVCVKCSAISRLTLEMGIEPNPNRTELSQWPSRTEPEPSFLGSIPVYKMKKLICFQITKQQLFLGIWQHHTSWTGTRICRCLSVALNTCYEYCKWTSVFSVWHWASL